MDDAFLALFTAFFAVVVLIPFLAASGLVGFDFFHPHPLQLDEYDVVADGRACASFTPFGAANVSVNGVPVNATFGNGTACVPVTGPSRISISKDGSVVSFRAGQGNRSAGAASLRLSVPARARAYEHVPVTVTLAGSGETVRHIVIRVDGNPVRSIPIRNGTATEPIRLAGGLHDIVAEVGDESVVAHVNVEQRFSSPLLFPLLLLPWLFLFRKRLHLLALGTAGFVLLSSAVLMVADFAALAVVFGVLTVAGFLLAKEKFPKKMELRGISSESKQALLLFGIFVLLTTAPKLFFSDHTPWNVYYERQANDVFYDGHVHAYDELSYGGRSMSFPPGYFAAKAAFMWFLGLEPGEFATTLFSLLSNGLLILSLVHFAAGRFRSEARIVFALAFMMTLFVFTLVSANVMHVLSLALLLFSLSLFGERPLFSGIVLGAAAVVHPFTLVAFALCAFALCLDGGKNVRSIAPPLGIGLLLFGMLYAPTLLALGMPSEQAAGEWGYLLHWGFPSLIMEFALAIPLFLFAAWKQKGGSAAFFALLLLAYSFISFRLNIAVAFVGALLAARLVQEHPRLFGVMFVALLLNTVPFLFVMTGYARPCDDIFLTDECTTAMEYLSLYPRNTTVLAPLLFGHEITGLAGLKVVADPYVEYADVHRLQDVMQFERGGNDELAAKWNASLSIGGTCSGDRVYDNGYVSVCNHQL